MFSAGANNTDMGLGEMIRLQILDVDGVRLGVIAFEPAQPDAGIHAELQQILDSMRVDRAS